MSIIRVIAVAICFLYSVVVVADDWTGKGEFGFVQVSGNTESETFAAGLEMEKIHEDWKHNVELAGVRASSNNVNSAENYSAEWRSEYSFSKRTYGYGDLRFFDDKFDSFEEIYTASLGAGYKLISRERLNWDVSAGVGYRDTTIETIGDDDSGIAYLVESDYSHQITDTSRLKNITRVEISEDNTFTRNKTSLSVDINSSLALKASYEIRHNSNPEPGFKSVDRTTSINVVYKF